MPRSYQLEVMLWDETGWRIHPSSPFTTLVDALRYFHRAERRTELYANVRILIDGTFTGIIARGEK